MPARQNSEAFEGFPHAMSCLAATVGLPAVDGLCATFGALYLAFEGPSDAIFPLQAARILLGVQHGSRSELVMGDVVVGVDGSAQSLIALDLAAREARWRSSRLRVVYVYEPSHARDIEVIAAVTAASTSISAASSNRMLHEAHHHTDDQREEAQRHAEARLRAFIHDSELRGIDVQLTAIADERPTAALLRASADEDLLVVGSRGLGGFKGLLMGSVSQQCVQHATCPVLVVRDGRE